MIRSSIPAAIVEAGGKWVIPGLIDTYVHLIVRAASGSAILGVAGLATILERRRRQRRRPA